jgi:hypothetical protein
MKDLKFDMLSRENQMVLLSDFATRICSIEYYDHRIALYALNNIYIEAYQNIETKEIEKIVSIDFRDLDKFLLHITFSSLFTKEKVK